MENTKVKVFFFIDSFKVGGMHKQVLNLVKNLNKDTFLTVVCTQLSVGGLYEDFKQTNCILYDLKWKRKFDFSTVFRLIKILKVERPHIIFITEAQPFVYFRFARLFWNNAIIQLGSFRALTFWKGHLNKIYKPIDNFFSNWLYATSEYVIVNSNAMNKHYSGIIKINSSRPLKIIYNGNDFKFVLTKSRDTIRYELNLAFDDIFLIMVARLDPWKDFLTLFEAMKLVQKATSKAKLFLVGEGILRDQLEQLVINMDLSKNVFLIGEKADISNYIRAADISILSTNGEGFSNSILESMALGVPVIATDIGGNTELLGSNNEFGILVSPKSYILLAEAIITLMNNESLQKSISLAAKERIQSLCSINHYISEYEELFLKCMKSRT